MSCIHCSSPPFHLQNQRHNAKIPANLFGKISTKRHCNVNNVKVGVFSMNNFEAFPTCITLAVAKPADTEVLLKTSAVLIFFYLLANFVVPQFITKSFEDIADENEKPSSTDSLDEAKTSSTRKRGFDSTKPK
ncbi:uncharacterized protein LOC110723867 [Chenopodium quinoa]|uniref:uncharacterized protein LOC110723867 n=1 Tax=Chenopodium quinoa TaxID=63459 RepID=UPI000B76CAB1|nr:uncharacterized protein LOC110723867 [Chenopodium quinoa]